MSDVLRILVAFGVNIYQPVHEVRHHQSPIMLVCHEWGMPLFRYLIGAAANVENQDWNGAASLSIIPGTSLEEVIEEILIMLLKVGTKVDLRGVISLSQDFYDHTGGRGASVAVPEVSGQKTLHFDH